MAVDGKGDDVRQFRLEDAGLNLDLPAYIAHYQLTAERLRLAKRDAIVMHPGPIVRGLEIAGDVADGPQSVITEQELFVTLDPPRLAPLIPQRVTRDR